MANIRVREENPIARRINLRPFLIRGAVARRLGVARAKRRKKQNARALLLYNLRSAPIIKLESVKLGVPSLKSGFLAH